jgi:hypothetical protein
MVVVTLSLRWVADVGACWPSPWPIGRRCDGGRGCSAEAALLTSVQDLMKTMPPALCCSPTRRKFTFDLGCICSCLQKNYKVKKLDNHFVPTSRYSICACHVPR